MEEENIDIKQIEKIIKEPIKSTKQITYGYTNHIYSINDKYILKICVNERNYDNFKRASNFCQKYYGKINCPKVLYSCLDINDGKLWQIEEKAKGENLFFKWSKLSENEKAEVIEKICKELKRIHDIEILDVFEREFKQEEWKEKFERDISKKISSLEKKGLKYGGLYDKIKLYVSKNLNALDKTDYKVCHTDMHFDNIMIDGNNNITILDYDRLRIASLDYELNIFNIMEQTPELVVNQELKGKVNKKDYEKFLDKFKDKYEEMFKFNQLDERLNIYALKHYLGLLSVVKEKDRVVNVLMEIVSEKNKDKNQLER